MKQTKTTIVLVAKWLVVLAISLAVLHSGAFASSPPPAAGTACDASCGMRCPCCVSNAPATNSSVPLAPTPPSRVSVEKGFQVLPVLAVLLSPVSDVSSLALPGVFSVSSCPEAPLYQRHCVYLI